MPRFCTRAAHAALMPAKINVLRLNVALDGDLAVGGFVAEEADKVGRVVLDNVVVDDGVNVLGVVAWNQDSVVF